MAGMVAGTQALRNISSITRRHMTQEITEGIPLPNTHLTLAQRNHLSRHIKDLGETWHFKANNYDQHSIDKNVMYSVELHPEGDGRLLLRNRGNHSIYYPKREVFDFIIPSDEPNIVLAMPNLPNHWKMGHTSMTKNDVRFAGEMAFNNKGKLRGWNGASGHFRPYNYLHHENLTPWTRRILTPDKFQNVYFR